MLTASLSSKGQLTLPKALRDAFHLRAGSRVTFTLSEGEAVMKPLSCGVDDVFGILKRKGQPSVTVDAMNAAIRQRLTREVRP